MQTCHVYLIMQVLMYYFLLFVAVVIRDGQPNFIGEDFSLLGKAQTSG